MSCTVRAVYGRHVAAGGEEVLFDRAARQCLPRTGGSDTLFGVDTNFGPAGTCNKSAVSARPMARRSHALPRPTKPRVVFPCHRIPIRGYLCRSAVINNVPQPENRVPGQKILFRARALVQPRSNSIGRESRRLLSENA
jgi:hypothetical protein